jgi:GTPase Era involved in 16S rRNA processing
MPAGQSHAATPGELAVELVREKLYRRLNQELPYRLTVTQEVVHTLKFRAQVPAEPGAAPAAAADGPGETGAVPSAAPAEAAAMAAVPGEGSPEGLYIRIRVDVASKGIKSIVVGKGGGVIQKYVAEPTQAELARILKRPVKLVVGVKIVG